jgi:uncharacterized spore protein YtfJ
MPSSVEALIERVMGELHRIVRTETVVGDPVHAGSVTLIPVSRISFGFGAGGGRDDKGHSGTGGGATVEPVAFVVIDADGKVQVMTLKDKEIGLAQLAHLVPEAVDKLRQVLSKRKRPHDTPADQPQDASEDP